MIISSGGRVGINAYPSQQYQLYVNGNSAFEGKINVNGNGIFSGKVSIGTSANLQTLDVNGRVNITEGVIQRGGTALTTTSDLGLYSRIPGNWMRFVTNVAPIRFFSDDGTGSTANMTIESNGKVGIATTTPDAMLEVLTRNEKGILVRTLFGQGYNYGFLCVADGENTKAFALTRSDLSKEVFSVYGNGNVHAQAIYAMRLWAVFNPMDQYPDFVFDEKYKRMTFEEKEKYYKKYKHLPTVPSAEDVKKDGIDISKTLSATLLNVEENRLDITDLYKEIIKLKKENEEIKLELKKMKNK